nr:hypothetical protein [uncultured Carboxylicivirga sp.]
MKMKNVVLIFLISIIPMHITAQENAKADLSLGVDLYSRYVWRGLLFSDAPNIQPYISISKSGFSLTAWGSYATSKNYAEVDLFLSYTFKGLTIGVSDYYYEIESDLGLHDYWDWEQSTTFHLGEAYLAYGLPVEKFPLQITASMLIYGYDLNTEGDQNYSTYFELMYPFSFNDYDLSFTLGATPSKGFYTSYNGAVINLALGASKNINVTEKFSIPLNISFIYNPSADDIFLVAGFSF